jgi:hypothetical protein
MHMAFRSGMSPAGKNTRTMENPMYDQFLTFKLDLMRSEMINRVQVCMRP